MIWIKRIASTPAPSGHIIDSFETGDDKSTNAPSIRATLEKLNLKAEIDDNNYASDKTLSGAKIKQMFDSVDGVALDDTTPSATSVYSSSKVMSELDTLTTNLTTALLDRFYPIGCVVITFQEMEDQDLIARYGGHSWSPVQGGRFLITSDSKHAIGTTGGSSTVTLTTDNLPNHTHSYYRSNTSTSSHTLAESEMPKHDHQFNGGFTFTWGVSGLSGQVSIPGAEAVAGGPTSNNLTTSQNDWGWTKTAGSGGSHTHPISRTYTTTSSAGSGTAVNIEPPYIAVYMWRRTA